MIVLTIMLFSCISFKEKQQIESQEKRYERSRRYRNGKHGAEWLSSYLIPQWGRGKTHSVPKPATNCTIYKGPKSQKKPSYFYNWF